MSKPAAQDRRLLSAFALGNAGAVLAYLPFLSLLLPLKVEAMAGASRVAVLSAILFGGALAASIGNIAVGLLIDRALARGGSRRRWIALGVVATMAGYALILAAQRPFALFMAVMALQLAINALVAPITLVMAEEVADARKSLAGGLLALGQPLAMLAATGLVVLFDRSEAAAYAAICAGIVVLALPLLVTPGRPVPLAAANDPPTARGGLVGLALSRLLLLTANSSLTGILVYYFESLAHHLPAGDVARRVGLIGMAANAAAAVMAVTVAGRLHRWGGRRAVVVASALAAGAALALMDLIDGWRGAALGYGLFVCAVQVFASQHSAMVAQALRNPRHKARDLGFQNLANTVPSVLGPGIVMVFYRGGAMPGLLWTLVALTIGAAALLARVRISGD